MALDFFSEVRILPVLLHEQFFIQCVRVLVDLEIFAEVLESIADYRANVDDRNYEIFGAKCSQEWTGRVELFQEVIIVDPAESQPESIGQQ